MLADDVVSRARYRTDTSAGVAMALRLTESEQQALRERAEDEGISMQEAARRAVREFVSRGEHRDRVAIAARTVMTTHAEAIRRSGQPRSG